MIAPEKIKNILVIRLSSLGDVILTTPVFFNLRHRLKQAKISVLTKTQYREVFFNNPDVDEILTLENDESLFHLISRLRNQNYDLVVDLHANLRSFLISLGLGVPVIRYDKENWSRSMLVYFKKHSPKLNNMVVDRYLDKLSILGIKNPDSSTKIYLNEDERKWATEFLAKRNIFSQDVIIGLNPGAKWQTKMWPLENWKELLALSSKSKMKWVVFGDQKDKVFTDKIASAAASLNISLIGFAGNTTLRQLFALVARCRVLLTTDSGTMHVAQALKVPVTILLGPTVEGFGFVRVSNSQDRILARDLSCRPCSLHGSNYCKKGDQECLAKIKAIDVFKAMKEQLDAQI